MIEPKQIHRYYKTASLGEIKEVHLHHLSGVNGSGLGRCSCVRHKNENGVVHCCPIMGKARLNPLKVIAIQGLELGMAVLSTNGKYLRKELQ